MGTSSGYGNLLGGIGVIAAVILLQLAREKASSPSAPIEIRQKEL